MDSFQALGVAYSFDPQQNHRIFASFPMTSQEKLNIREEEKQRQCEWQADDELWRLQHDLQ